MKKYSKFTWLIPWFICGLGAVFYAYEFFLRITPSVMTTELKNFFHIQDGQLGSLSAYYYYIYTPMQLAVGVLMDRYGPRRLLTLATLCCVAGQALFGMTDLLWLAKIGRLLIGFGSAFAFIGALKLATIWLPKRFFAFFAGLATSIGMMGAILGDSLLSLAKNNLGWQNTVMLSAAFGILLALAIFVFVKDTIGIDNRTARKEAQKSSFKEVFQGLWIIVKMPQFWIVGIIGCFLFIPDTVFAEMWGIPYLTTQFHMSSLDAGFGISMVFWGWVMGGPLYGFISEKINSRKIPLAFAGFGSAMLLFILPNIPNMPEWGVFLGLFLLGFIASGEALVFAVGKEIGPKGFSGSALAFVNMAVMFGGVLLQPAFGYMLQYTQGDYQFILMTLPTGLLLAGILCIFCLKESFRKK